MVSTGDGTNSIFTVGLVCGVRQTNPNTNSRPHT